MKRSARRKRRAPGRPAATSALAARDRLLSAAVELFAQQGVAATTFAMIAKQAALTPAMLHYYFDDREHLLDAVVHERMAPVIGHVWDPITIDTPPTILIRGIVERLLDGIEQMPWIPTMWIREVLNEGGALRTRVLRCVPFDKVRILSAAIRRQQGARRLNPRVDPVLIIFSILGLVMVHCATTQFWADTFHRKRPDRTALQGHITGLLLDGLRHSSRSDPGRTAR
jgi:TetR/AcrR family transcriptional regulator